MFASRYRVVVAAPDECVARLRRRSRTAGVVSPTVRNMDTNTILEIIERRKSGRRVTDQCPLSIYWPTLAAAGLLILLAGFGLGKIT